MKNTVPTDISNSEDDLRTRTAISLPLTWVETSDRSRWLGLPFLLAAFSYGLPIAGGIQEKGEIWAEAIYESTQARATTLGFESSIILTLFWGSLYLLAFGMIWRYIRVATLQRFWPFFLVVVGMMASLLWSPYPGKVSVNIVHNIGVFAIAYSAAFHYRQDLSALLSNLGVALGLNLMVHILAVAALPAVAIYTDGRWCGFTSHPNTLGGIGFIALWVNGAALGFTNKPKFKIHLGFFLLSIVMLAGVQSMTSILCSLVAMGGTIILKRHYKSYQNRRSISGWISLASFCCVLIILLVFTVPISSMTALMGRSGDISGRDSIWLSAVDLILNAPLFGYGFDDNAYANQISGMVHSTYHNGFLDLAVRGGMLSLFFLLMLLIRWYRRLGRSTGLPTSFSTYFLPFILASILYNMTEATFFAARNILWITLLVIIIIPEITLSQLFHEHQHKVRS